jgi:transcriptional regulator with XRE-family HTH domain
MTLQQAVKELRRSSDWSQADLAEVLECSLITIKRYETSRAPKGAVLTRLAQLARHSGRLDLAKVFSDAFVSWAELRDLVKTWPDTCKS